MSAELTPTQARVLAFVRTHQAECQCSPTRAEIARHFEWASPNAAQECLEALERKGYIWLTGAKSRGIFIVDKRQGAA